MYLIRTSSFLPGLEVFNNKSYCDFSLYFRNLRKNISAKVLSSDAHVVPSLGYEQGPHGKTIALFWELFRELFPNLLFAELKRSSFLGLPTFHIHYECTPFT